jgi:hypothetical protein
MTRGEKPIPPSLRVAVLLLGIGFACSPSGAQRSDDGGPEAGAAIAPPLAPPAGGPPPAPAGACNADPWRPGEPYTDGNRVTNGTPTHVYECKPWPFSGWCPIAAYEPGKTGAPWEDAWLDVGACP